MIIQGIFILASFGDFNKDGLLDVYITAYVFNGSTILGPDDEIIGFNHDCSANQLFINNGNFKKEIEFYKIFYNTKEGITKFYKLYHI